MARTRRGKRSQLARELRNRELLRLGDNVTMKAASRLQTPFVLMAGTPSGIQPVTMGLTEATRRFPRAYGAFDSLPAPRPVEWVK